MKDPVWLKVFEKACYASGFIADKAVKIALKVRGFVRDNKEDTTQGGVDGDRKVH